MAHNQSPERIGKYEITGALGRGSMGVVYKGVDPEIGRTVAIKTLRKVSTQTKEDNSALERFKIEARSAGNLRHPNIITVFDVNIEADTPYIVMDYVEGRSLHSLLKERGKFSIEETLGLLSQVADGLDAAHARSIIHRDIKPSNLIVDNQGRVYILDFGVARINEEMNQTEDGRPAEPVMGTPGYMSPEQILNEPLDARSDLFALAIVAFEMLTGRRPFSGKNFTEIVSNILNTKAEPLTKYAPDVPLALEVEMERALARDKQQRFASAAQMIKAFTIAVGVQPGTASKNSNTDLIRPRKASEWKSIKVSPDDGSANKRSVASPARQPETPRPQASAGSHLPQTSAAWRGGSPRSGGGGSYAPGGQMFKESNSSLAGAGSFRRYSGNPLVRILTVGLGLSCLILGIGIVYMLLFKKEPPKVPASTPTAEVNHNVEQMAIPPLASLGELREIRPVAIPANKTVSEMEDEQVLSVLLRSDLSETVMLDALREGKERGLPDLVDACVNPLQHDSYVVRLETLKLLADLNDKRIVPIVLESLDDHDPLVRTQAAKTLSQLGSRTAISYLRTRYIKEEIPQVKAAIKRAIEEINGFPMKDI